MTILMHLFRYSQFGSLELAHETQSMVFDLIADKTQPEAFLVQRTGGLDRTTFNGTYSIVGDWPGENRSVS